MRKHIVTKPLQDNLEDLENGSVVILHPNKYNPIHKKPISATYQDGYFYCKGSDPLNGPDYYWGDILAYCHGWVMDS